MCTISAFMAASSPLTVAAPTISAFIAALSPLMSGYSNLAFVAAPSPLVSGCIDSPFTSLHQTLTILIVLLLLAYPNIQHIFFSLIYSLRILFLYIYPSSFFFYNRHWLTHICRLTQTLCIYAPIHTHTSSYTYMPHATRLWTTFSPTSSWCGLETSVVHTTDANGREQISFFVHNYFLSSNLLSIFVSIIVCLHCSLYSRFLMLT